MKYNIFNRKPDVEMLRSINVSDIEWCDEAVLIRVKNGKGTLAHRISEEDEDYAFFSQLLLEDKPIIQGKYPICSTCAGMLATGYGIENINSEELIKVRECMNTEYKGIKDYSDPFCQDSFLLNLSLGDKHMFLQNIGTDYPLLPLMVLNLGIINVSRTCHEVVPASLIH